MEALYVVIGHTYSGCEVCMGAYWRENPSNSQGMDAYAHDYGSGCRLRVCVAGGRTQVAMELF